MSTFSLTAYHPYPTYYWEWSPTGGGWTNVTNLSGYASGQGTSSITIDSLLAEENGHVRCAVTNPEGVITYSREAVLTGGVITDPLVFVTHPRDLTLLPSLHFVKHPIPLELIG